MEAIDVPALRQVLDSNPGERKNGGGPLLPYTGAIREGTPSILWYFWHMKNHPIADAADRIDWTKSNRVLAKELGYAPGVVRYWRKKLARPHGSPTPRKAVYDEVDWSLGYKQIAQKYGVSLWTARKWKRKRQGTYYKGANLRGDGRASRRANSIKACVVCSYAKLPDALHIHHITPRAEGGSDALENLVVLCPTCHAEAHAGLLSTAVLSSFSLATVSTPTFRPSIPM